MAQPFARFARQFCAARSVKSRFDRRPRLTVDSLEDRTTPSTIVVTSAADSGPGTLRDAIDQANGLAGADTITFDTAGVFATPQTIDLLTALPNIAAQLTIQGPGASNLTVQRDAAAANFRILTFLGSELNLSGFTITGGLSSTGNGGAIQAFGTLTLESMVLTGNQAGAQSTLPRSGGAVAMSQGGDLVVRDTTISGNSAAKNGGAIYFLQDGSLQVINSTISGNSTAFTGKYQGFYGGGAIYFFGIADSPLTIVNSTIANNMTTGSGGALLFEDAVADVLVENSTITGNASTVTTAGYGGGGIANPTDAYEAVTITVQNSVISGNTAVSAAQGPDILSPSTVNVNYSALGDPTDGFTLTGRHNLTGSPAALGLGALADNGGPTLTEIPQPGSPLIDTGSNNLAPAGVASDQRGFGFHRTFNGTVDIGAVEVQPVGLPFALNDPTPLTTPGGSTYTFDVTYWDPTGTNNGIQFGTVGSNLAAIIVTGPDGNPVPVSIVNVSPQTDATPIVVTYQIEAPGGDWDSADDGIYTVQVGANQVQDLDGHFVPNDFLDPIRIILPRTLTVTSAADSGAGSLRAVLTAANAFPSDDTIAFDPAVFGTPQVVHLASALPTIAADGGDLTIAGPGATNLTVDGGGQFRVFDSRAANLTLSGLKVIGGLATNDIGGGLKSTGNVTLDHVVFSGNAATGDPRFPFDTGSGGAVALVVGDGFLRVVDSTISGNTAEFNGGGLFLHYSLYGSLLLENSTVSGNTTTFTGNYQGYFGGGGVFLAGVPSPAPPPGFFPGAFTVRNSTVANNSSAGSGGAIFGNGLLGAVLVQDSTISGNSAVSAGAATHYPAEHFGGGGLGAVFSSPTFVLANSVVSGNTNPGGAGDIQAANPVQMYYSAVGDGTGFTISANSTGNLPFGTDPKLGPLQDNGGPTQTMAPLPGSPLRDAGNNGFTLGATADQRGLDREDPATGVVDIGALEAQAATVTIAPAAGQASPTNNNTSVKFTVVFDQPVTGFDASGIDLGGSTAAGTLAADVTAVSPTTYTVTVTGIAGDGDVVAAVRAGTAAVGVNASGQPNLPSPSAATVTVDTTGPQATVNVATGQADPTNAGPIRFDVQFDEAVTGFDASDVVVTSSIGDALTASVAPGGGPNSFVVTVSGMTGSSLVTASIPAGAATDVAGNQSLASTSTDNIVNYDVTPPTVTIHQAAAQGDPAGGLSVVFDVVFTEPVTGFDGTKVNLSDSTAAGTLLATVTGAGPAYTVTVTGMTSGGTVTATIDPGVVTDLAGNFNVGSTSTDNSVTYVHSGVVHLSAATFTAFEQTDTQVTVTVQRTDGSDGPLDVHYATADGTALAGADYTAVSGNFHWDAGDTSDRTIVVPILNDAGLEPDSAFTVNLSDISLPGALGSPSTGAVTIFEEAGLAFSAPTFQTAESDTGADRVAHVTVSRLFGGDGAASVDYAITAGTATAGADYTVAASAGTLTWADGDTADKTIDITIKDDTLSEGRETILLALSNPGGNALLGAQATATLVIDHSEGKTIQASARPPQAVVTDSDGDLVTLKLAGKVGSLTYYLTNDSGPISEVDLTGTDPAKSAVSILVKKPRGGTGDGRTTIGEVDGLGAAGLRSLSAGKADLVGAGIAFNGYVGAVALGNVSNGADITLAGAAPAKPKTAAVKIVAGVIGDGTDIAATAPLGRLTATAIGDGSITAPSVGAIAVKGKKATKTTPGIAGDFKSDVSISGAGVDPVKGKALKSLTAAGALTGSTITVGGNVGLVKAGSVTGTTVDVAGKLGPVLVTGAVTGSTITTGGSVGLVSVGSFADSRLLAGYTGPDTGVGGAFTPGVSVGPFVVKAKVNGFSQSYVIAAQIKNVTLASVDPTIAGTKFGFVYHEKLSALTVKAPAFKFNAKGPAVQDLAGTDFEVAKV